MTYKNIISGNKSCISVKAPMKGLVNVLQHAGCINDLAWECRGKETAVYNNKSSVVADDSRFSSRCYSGSRLNCLN